MLFDGNEPAVLTKPEPVVLTKPRTLRNRLGTRKRFVCLNGPKQINAIFVKQPQKRVPVKCLRQNVGFSEVEARTQDLISKDQFEVRKFQRAVAAYEAQNKALKNYATIYVDEIEARRNKARRTGVALSA